METLLNSISVIALGYLLGSIPFAFLIGKLRGVDIREKAVDGARGASLTWKNVGKVYGILVATFDISKGFLSVMIADRICGNPMITVLAGLAAIIGHNWSLYMGFTGGKGAATTGGNLFYLMPKELLIAFLIILLPLCIIRKKKYFKFSIINKKFKTSNFFSGVFFTVLCTVVIAYDRKSITSFSPIIYSIPMIIKDAEIKKRLKS